MYYQEMVVGNKIWFKTRPNGPWILKTLYTNSYLDL